MPSVAELLRQGDRKFYHCAPPADEAEIQQLIRECHLQLPDEYLDLLRFTNGGETELALPPRLFVPYEVEYVLELLRDKPFDEIHDSFFIIGGNGGLETIAFDLRSKPPYPVVMIDLIGGGKTAIEIAPDFTAFLAAVGFEYQDNEC
jgi:hypothetical protein